MKMKQKRDTKYVLTLSEEDAQELAEIVGCASCGDEIDLPNRLYSLLCDNGLESTMKYESVSLISS